MITRPFRRNFNNEQFSPPSEANLQVCCNFTKWEHSGSTENPGPAGSGLRSKEWVCRKESAQQMPRERERQDKTGYWVPGSSPSRDKAAASVPWYVFHNSTSPHFLSLGCVLATCNQTPRENTKCSDISEKNSCPPSLRDQGRPSRGTDDGPFADSQDTRLQGEKNNAQPTHSEIQAVTHREKMPHFLEDPSSQFSPCIPWYNSKSFQHIPLCLCSL